MTLVKCDKKILQLFQKILVKKKKKEKSLHYISPILYTFEISTHFNLLSTRINPTYWHKSNFAASNANRLSRGEKRGQKPKKRARHCSKILGWKVEQRSIHLISTMTDIFITFEISNKNLKNGEIEVFLEKSTNTNNQYQSLFVRIDPSNIRVIHEIALRQ